MLGSKCKPSGVSATELDAVKFNCMYRYKIPNMVGYVCMEAAIKAFKDNEEIRDITLRELSQYGKSHQFGDCRLEEAEVGVKYDYADCGDSKLYDMYATLESLKADIKERETMLRQLPVSGLADPETGEMLYPPVRSSKTSIKTTFKKQP